MKAKEKRLTLDELKNRLMKRYGVSPAVRTFKSSYNTSENTVDDILDAITEFIQNYPEKTLELIEFVGKGEDFRYYFSDMEAVKELAALRTSDPDSFYRILKKEELFINYILRSMKAYNNVIISLGPEYIDNLLKTYEDEEDDWDEQ